MIASGATFDFFSGRIKQAPKWIRDAGFEWLYRLTKDFRRLWVRYIIYNIIFIPLFTLQLAGIIKFKRKEANDEDVAQGAKDQSRAPFPAARQN